ncbi:MAG: SIS domain-containing protein [Gemmatimonadetes bacterium]|nr:SIS domain-containing protein [Gemmatimonadota bacterium]MYA78084.1 SIS domain-containing protein [Gemmatimonadota bacterium]MYG17545.1 SIS domain-containing protein [Gemmatimonadota bacterium]MYH20291.1 SIS domain-containing protein [Gemmatimonadota bacterium]MYK97531.1 SIS domain-containing protein [Gemmatimonadota bacterium]
MIQDIDRTRRVVGIGSNVVDVIYRVNRIAGPEEKTYILPDDAGSVVTEIAGGVTLNHLAWTAQMGVPAGLFGFQGDDRYGAMIRDEMDRHGIDRSAIRVIEGRASGFSVVNVAEDADRAIYMARALTAETTAAHVETHFADYIRSAAMVTTEISQLPLDAVIAVLRIAREAGVPTVLDVDVPPEFAIEVAGLGSAEDFEEALRLADVIKPAKAAALQMVEADTSEERAEGIFNRYGARLVAITEGAQGSVVTDGKQTVRVPAKPVEARDTTGAGDAFLGGLIAGLFHGLSLRDTASLANACGAVCCRIPGAFPQLGSSRDDVMALYDGTRIPDRNAPETVTASERATVQVEAAGAASPDAASPGAASPGAAGLKAVQRTAEALSTLRDGMSNAYFDEAIAIIRKSEAASGRVHVTGVGKSRHIGRKLAATLQSTGTKTYFLDPADCNHGDSGQVAPGDVVIALSHSGETEELLAAVQTLTSIGATIIAITGDPSSSLARSSAAILHVPVANEAGPLGLAPTASTSCQLAVADGLAMALKAGRGFTREEFARYHPGGSIGKRLKNKKGTP